MPITAAAGRPASDRLLVLSTDPAVIDAARDAAGRARRPAMLLASGREALGMLAAPGLREAPQLVCDPADAGPHWRDLLAAAAEMRGRPPLVLVSNRAGPVQQGLPAMPPDSRRLEAALRARPAAADPAPGAEALRSGLCRGEIAVRYQPMVRLADGRPVMVEALARWEPSYPPVPPDRFIPLVARAGLMRSLSSHVIRRAVADIGALRGAMGVGVTVNLPLDLLLRPELPAWLARALRFSALPPSALSLELTETHKVEDRSALARALRRLRAAGHGVMLDDILADDPRAALFDLPFAALKLDRSLVNALPRDARLRRFLRGLARAADRRGQVLVAEGVATPGAPEMLAELGVHWGQGFMIARPLPARALPDWSARWRARGPG